MKHGKLNEKELHTGRRVWMLIPEEGYLDQVTITKSPYNCGFDLGPDVGVKYVNKLIGITFCGSTMDIPLCLLNKGFIMFRSEAKGVKWMKRFSIKRRYEALRNGYIDEIDSNMFAIPINKGMVGMSLSSDPVNDSINPISDYGFDEEESLSIDVIEAAFFADRISCMLRRHAEFAARLGAEHIRKVQGRKKIAVETWMAMSNPSTEVRYIGQ